MAPSLGLIHWLEWLTELRKTPYSLDDCFIIKSPDGRDAQGEAEERAEPPRPLWAHALRPLHKSTNQELCGRRPAGGYRGCITQHG